MLESAIDWPETPDERIYRREAFQKEYLIGYPRWWVEPYEVRPIFVLSTARSGTTTCATLLNGSDDVSAFHEPAPRLWHLGDDAWHERLLDFHEIYWSARRDVMSVCHGAAMTFCEVNNRLTPLVPFLRFPEARYLYLFREMGGYVRSAVRWGIYTEWDRARVGRPNPDPGLDAGQSNAWYWCGLHERILAFLETIPDDRKAYLPFEALQARDVRGVQSVMERLGLSRPDEGYIEHVLNARLNPSRNDAPVPMTWEAFHDHARDIYRRVHAQVS